MSTPTAILAIDQGTTSTRAILFTPDAEKLCIAQREFAQHYPRNGWVEHDPEEIWQTTVAVCEEVLAYAQAHAVTVAGIGITNQRETTMVWQKSNGKPVYPAIVWQDRRTTQQCKALVDLSDVVTQKTGLRLDPYFSATKIQWILDNVPGSRAQAENGDLLFGTIDTYLIWRLTAGKMHATDITNASRTLLCNITTLEWDEELLNAFDVPAAMLPVIKDNCDDFGETAPGVLSQTLPICGVAGDQQAALIGQCCFTPGMMKSTYGTGCFALVNTGTEIVYSQNQLLTTVAYAIKGTTHYALEGSIFIAGAAIQWCRDGIGIISSAAQTEAMAQDIDDDHGVVMVPAFAGLGAPYWDPNARGSLFGLTRGSTQAHIARAALESVCYQTYDLQTAMTRDGCRVNCLNVDGGMVANDWFCQWLSSILQVTVNRPKIMETTALGAAYLAALQLGLVKDPKSLAKANPIEHRFAPNMEDKQRRQLLHRWQRAIQATLLFAR